MANPMTTCEIIAELRDQAEVIGPGTERNLLMVAAERLDGLSGGWISVKDRMPEDGKFVLVCNDDGHMMIAKYESEVLRWEYKYINYDWDVWDDEEQGPVCWWMPLPKAPEVEG